MKKLYSTLIVVLAVFMLPKFAFTQIIKLNDDKGVKFGIGLMGAATRPFTDFNNPIISYQAGLSLLVEPMHFFRFTIEANKGMLKGGVPKFGNIEHNTTHFTNSYFSTSAHIQLNPFMVVNPELRNVVLDVISCAYAGAGIGMLYSDARSRDFLDPSYGAVGRYKNADYFIALEAGFSIPILKLNNGGRLILNLNYKTLRTSTDLIDGYNPPVEANNHNDTYSTYGGGFIINI